MAPTAEAESRDSLQSAHRMYHHKSVDTGFPSTHFGDVG